MQPHDITPAVLRTALKAIHGARRLSGHPLLALHAVTLRLRADGMRDAPESRAWALAALVEESVRGELGRRRAGGDPAGAGAPAREARPEDVLADLRADFASGDVELEGLAVVYVRYLAPRRLTVDQLASELGVVRRTLDRRTTVGVAVLARALQAAERDAVRDVDRMPGRPAAERVVVEGSPAHGSALAERARSLDTMLGAVLDTVRDDARAVRLTPPEAEAILLAPAPDLDSYRLGRVVEWSQPRYRLDERFVALSLVVDDGEEASGGRWRTVTRRFDSLPAVLDAIDEPACVILGPPGSGKSTLLRRLDLDVACEALRGDDDRVGFFVPLNHYRAPLGGLPPAPDVWLARRWAVRYPALPPLDVLLSEGRVTLLLDALNEMPHADGADYRSKVMAWKQLLHDVVEARPGNRVVFSCRSLDYSAPLSSSTLRVPQVRIEPLDDDQARRFLGLYTPVRADRIWRELEDTSQLDLLRTPYFLTLLVEYVESEDRIPIGRAGLFTGFVRQALRREIERDNPLFEPGALLSERDCRRLVSVRRSKRAFELPEEGPLFRCLAHLAFEMQRRSGAARDAQVRVDYRTAVDLLDHPLAHRILAAGTSLAVLDEPDVGATLSFFHQLLQEYFAARRLASAPEPGLVRAAWRAADVDPGVAELGATLPAAERLPALPTSGWEETSMLAAAMARDVDAFVGELAESNLAVAGQCAALPEVRESLGEATLAGLRVRLVGRSRDPAADLRARIQAADALGPLGDPRFERRQGPDGDYLLPPWVEIAGGRYELGSDDSGAADDARRREATLRPFRIGRFPVTNAEWACFVAAGGYDDPRWWDTPGAAAWRRGVGTAAGSRASFRILRARVRADPSILDAKRRQGLLPQSHYDDWVARMRMSDAEFEAHLEVYWPDGLKRAPEYWRDLDFNRPLQPVVGISWFEARAYANWLAAQSGLAVRLPTEPEWEAAARGRAGRRFAYGASADAGACNAAETRLQRTSPVGVFPDGDTPEGAADMTGNVKEWTAVDGPGVLSSMHADAGSSSDELVDDPQALRGGSWAEAAGSMAAWRRSVKPAALRVKDSGVRLVVVHG